MDWITIVMLVVAGLFGVSFVDIKGIWAKLGLSRQPDPVDDMADAIRSLHSVIDYCLAHGGDIVAGELEQLIPKVASLPIRRDE